MNTAVKAAMLGEEPKSRKQERTEKKFGRLAGKLKKLGEKGEKYASTDTPEGEQSGKERRYHKKVGKLWNKLKEASNEMDGIGAKKDKTEFTKTDANKTPEKKIEYTRVGTEEDEPTMSRRERRQERKEDKREYTRVGTEEGTSNRNADDVYGTTSQGNKSPKKELEWTNVGTEEYKPEMSRREHRQERRQERKEDKREWTRVEPDNTSSTPATTTTPSDTDVKAAAAGGKFTLTKFKPKK